MKKNKEKIKIKFSDWVLLLVGGFLDVIEEFRDPFNLISNYYQSHHGYIPVKYKKSYFTHTIWRMIKRNEIIREKNEKKNTILRLTEIGKTKIKNKFPLLYLKNKRWDEKWRLVLFDIEERTKLIRDSLRRKLKQLGFAPLQKSVWISPFDFLKEFEIFIKEIKIKNMVILLETKDLKLENKKELGKLWKIDELNDEYKEIYSALKKLEHKTNYLKLKNDRDKILNNLRQKIINVLLKDPNLPKEFLPENWVGERVEGMIKELKLFER